MPGEARTRSTGRTAPGSVDAGRLEITLDAAPLAIEHVKGPLEEAIVHADQHRDHVVRRHEAESRVKIVLEVARHLEIGTKDIGLAIIVEDDRARHTHEVEEQGHNDTRAVLARRAMHQHRRFPFQQRVGHRCKMAQERLRHQAVVVSHHLGRPPSGRIAAERLPHVLALRAQVGVHVEVEQAALRSAPQVRRLVALHRRAKIGDRAKAEFGKLRIMLVEEAGRPFRTEQDARSHGPPACAWQAAHVAEIETGKRCSHQLGSLAGG